jgi:hypothetical protein
MLLKHTFLFVNILVEIPESYLNNEKDKKEYYATRQKLRSDANKIRWNTRDWTGHGGATIEWDDSLAQAARETLSPDQKNEFDQKWKEFKTWTDKKKQEDKTYRQNTNGKYYADVEYFLTDFKMDKKLNYQNKKTQLSSVPASTDGYTLTDEAKKQLNLTKYTEGTGENVDNGYQVNIQFDATGITLRNVSDPKLQRDARAWHNKSQLMYNQGKNWNLKEVKKEDKYSGVKPK